MSLVQSRLRPVFGLLVCCLLAPPGLQAQRMQRLALPQLDTEVKLLASDGAVSDEFGLTVAINGDTVVVGARRDEDNGVDSGSVYVYEREGGVWTEQDKITPADGAAGDLFGHDVSISGDTMLVGAWRDDDLGADSGSAYIFVRSGGVWSQQAKLHASDGEAGDFFGWTGVVHGDTAIIGAYGDDDNAGAAYVFVRSGTSWTQQAKLTASDRAPDDIFGKATGLAGNIAIVGSRWDDDLGENSGSAYVFVRNGTTWSQQAKLLPADGAAGDTFGRDVWVSGTTAIVGSPRDDDSGSASGSAYVFTRSGTVWSQQAKLLADDGEKGDVFGKSVVVLGDTALVGAPKGELEGSAPTGEGPGSVYVFTRQGATWSLVDKLEPSDGVPTDFFAWDVSFSGMTAVSGAPLQDDKGENSGAAYVFEPSGLILAVAGACPGPVTLHITNAPPTSEVGSVNAENNDGFVKGGTLCPGVNLEIGEPFQLPPTWIKVNTLGVGSGTRTLEVDRCWIESLALANCETTGAIFVE